MNHTQNLHLPQWEETDRILRTDFNGAMEAIDTGVKAVNDAVTTLGTTKATAASVTALAGRVSAVESGKADSTSVNAALAQKADASALTAETQARQNADAALQSAIPRIVSGSFVGNGSSSGQTIHLGFRPKLLLIHGKTYTDDKTQLLFVYDGVQTAIVSNGILQLSVNYITLTDSGFSTVGTIHNISGWTEKYLAIG